MGSLIFNVDQNSHCEQFLRREGVYDQVGVATSFDHERGRYVVELDGSAGEEEKGGNMLNLKPENLVKGLRRKQQKGK